jgi:uncharacterized protein YkwD
VRKNAIVVAVILALLGAMTLANVALAAKADKPANSPPGKTKVGKATDSTGQVNDVEENIKCTILHKAKEITVSINALPAHVLNHGDALADGENAAECEERVAELTGGVDPTDPTDPDPTDLDPTDPDPTDPVGTIGTLQQKEAEPDENAQTEHTETVQTCDRKNIELVRAEKLTLDLHNKTRKENGLKELCVDPTLTRVAREHSKDMIKKGYFGHTSADGKSSAKRLKDSGYNWSATAENIAWGSGSYSNPKSRFKAWMESKGHKVNILNGKYEEVGIGATSGELLKKSGQEETVYTVDFGSKKKK